jgi:hypothetical protein
MTSMRIRLLSWLLLFFFAFTVVGCVIGLSEKKKRKPQAITETKIHYLYPSRNECNTIDYRFYKKEISSGHFAETRIDLTPEEQQLILSRAMAVNFFQMPDSLKQLVPNSSAQQRQYLRIQSAPLDHTVEWTGPLSDYRNTSLPGLMQYVDSIVRSTTQYKELPDSSELR